MLKLVSSINFVRAHWHSQYTYTDTFNAHILIHSIHIHIQYTYTDTVNTHILIHSIHIHIQYTYWHSQYTYTNTFNAHTFNTHTHSIHIYWYIQYIYTFNTQTPIHSIPDTFNTHTMMHISHNFSFWTARLYYKRVVRPGNQKFSWTSAEEYLPCKASGSELSCDLI